MKKVLKFGKVDANNCGRKINAVEIEIELENKEKGLCLSMVGSVWNNRHSDWIGGGQNYDEILSYFPNNKKVKRIVEIWKQYHLNDLNAGTPVQSAFLKELHSDGSRYDYRADCEALKDAGLYNDEGYVYGSGWLFREIPQNIIDEIKVILV